MKQFIIMIVCFFIFTTISNAFIKDLDFEDFFQQNQALLDQNENKHVESWFLPNMRPVLINYDLIRFEFEELASASDEFIRDWVTREFSFLTAELASALSDLGLVHEGKGEPLPFIVNPIIKKRVFFRQETSSYIMPFEIPKRADGATGFVDVKGMGLTPPVKLSETKNDWKKKLYKATSQANIFVGDALREYAYASLVDSLLESAPSDIPSTVNGIYAILSPNFLVDKHVFPPRPVFSNISHTYLPSAVVIRQATLTTPSDKKIQSNLERWLYTAYGITTQCDDGHPNAVFSLDVALGLPNADTNASPSIVDTSKFSVVGKTDPRHVIVDHDHYEQDWFAFDQCLAENVERVKSGNRLSHLREYCIRTLSSSLHTVRESNLHIDQRAQQLFEVWGHDKSTLPNACYDDWLSNNMTHHLIEKTLPALIKEYDPRIWEFDKVEVWQEREKTKDQLLRELAKESIDESPIMPSKSWQDFEQFILEFLHSTLNQLKNQLKQLD